jgi:flavin-dependent dehydrogenase
MGQDLKPHHPSSPSDTCDVAIVAAGPYGLSAAAHLSSLGIVTRHSRSWVCQAVGAGLYRYAS